MKILLTIVLLLLSSSAEADYLYSVAVPSAFSGLPAAVGGFNIETVVPQIRTPLLGWWEAWLTKGGSGKSHRATIKKTPFPGGKTLWTIQAEGDAWFKYLRAWSKAEPQVDGPIRLYRANDLAAGKCEKFAAAELVRVTSDGGALIQPSPETVCTGKPTDAGVPTNCSKKNRYWPDGGAVLRCGTKGGFYMRQWISGGPMAPPDPEPGTDAEEEKGKHESKPPVGYSADVWETPPAPTTKTCTVPFEEKCP